MAIPQHVHNYQRHGRSAAASRTMKMDVGPPRKRPIKAEEEIKFMGFSHLMIRYRNPLVAQSPLPMDHHLFRLDRFHFNPTDGSTHRVSFLFLQ
mmetsp:Transcript_34322/g.96744  ORF Transcript_34322/g.96744 Transcript_34322/m.96744 type:complete len:94 (+) Transcript_34322:336-617(+)